MLPYQVVYYPEFEPPRKWLLGMLLVLDRIVRIIPEDARHEDSESLQRLMDVLPDAVLRESPTLTDTSLDEVNLQRLSKAFAQLRQSHGNRDRVKVVIGPDGRLEFPGKVLLHHRKVSDAVLQLLREHETLDETSTSLAHRIGHEDVYVVPTTASELILSYVADRIARRIGCDTATDHQLPFAVNALDGLGVRNEAHVRGALLGTIINLEIPAEISTLTLNQYCSLRTAYSGIRTALQELIASISSVHHLGMIDDAEMLRERIEQAAKMFHQECEKYRKLKASRLIRQWTPIGLGGLLGILGAAAGNVGIGIGTAVGSLVVSVIQGMIGVEPPSREEHVYRMIGDLRHDVLNYAQLRALT